MYAASNRVPRVLNRLKSSCSIVQVPFDGNDLGIGRQPGAALDSSAYVDIKQDQTHLLDRNPGSVGRPLEGLVLVNSVE